MRNITRTDIGFLFVISFCLLVVYNVYTHKKDIDDNLYVTVAKMIKYEVGPAGREYVTFEYIYKNENLVYKIYAPDFEAKDLNRFF